MLLLDIFSSHKVSIVSASPNILKACLIHVNIFLYEALMPQWGAHNPVAFGD